MKQFHDAGNLIVIALTVIFFVAALFMKGFTKDLLLEAGVLLVSIKLIMYNHKNSKFNRELMHRIEEIRRDFLETKK